MSVKVDVSGCDVIPVNIHNPKAYIYLLPGMAEDFWDYLFGLAPHVSKGFMDIFNTLAERNCEWNSTQFTHLTGYQDCFEFKEGGFERIFCFRINNIYFITNWKKKDGAHHATIRDTRNYEKCFGMREANVWRGQKNG